MSYTTLHLLEHISVKVRRLCVFRRLFPGSRVNRNTAGQIIFYVIK